MKVVFLVWAGALALALGACDAGPSATGKAASAPTQRAYSSAYSGGSSGGSASVDPRDQPVPLVDGKPMWAANRRHTAEENADYQFGKNGKDFGAASEADYVKKVHAFVAQPPEGVERLTRANGDSLIYDPKSNTFAVVTREGAPRTMFKPRDGAAYWRQQTARQSSDQDAGSGAQS
ncbi:MAG: hypothetical protein ACREEW_05705 [Caulobacteraceae bacterium]